MEKRYGQERTVLNIILTGLLCAFLAPPASAQIVKQITDFKTTVAGPGALDDAGTAVYTGASTAQLGNNPQHAFLVLKFDAATGAGTTVLSAPDGVSPLVSVSDDGQWLAFPSPSDLTGQNHDQSIELFVMRTDGTQLMQVTNDPAVNGGSVTMVAMAGNGSRIAFLSNCDPLGTNSTHETQLFLVNRDGSGLIQLTFAVSGSFGAIAISDDGTRLVFAHDADLTGGNPDLGSEVFAINADGTNLRQMTSTPAEFESGSPALSGNGTRIAFQSNGDLTGGNADNQTEIFIINWNGTGLRQLTTTQTLLGITGDPASMSPSITDDGVYIYFFSNHSVLLAFPPINLDANFEIFRVKNDGTGLRTITNTAILSVFACALPTVSGNANRITYFELGPSSLAIKAADGTGGSQRTLVTYDLIFNGQADLSPDDSRVVFIQSTGLLGGGQLYRIQKDGSDLATVGSLGGTPASPSIAADNRTIAFSSTGDPGGSANSDGSEEIFTIQADGSGLRMLTSASADFDSSNPVITSDGNWIVFDSNADLTGSNADASREIFGVHPDGTGLIQLTNGPAGTTSTAPRPDALGNWLVFESNADLDGGNPDGTYEVFRVRLDGTGLQRLTGDPLHNSGTPDITNDGNWVVFSSTADPLGTNPEFNAEVFSFDISSGTLRQLTTMAIGNSSGPRISGNGIWVFFNSDAPIFEQDPDNPSDLYRVPATGGTIQRVGGLRAGVLGSIGGIDLGSMSIGIGGGNAIASGDSGDISVFSGIGNFTENNPDLLPEIWVIDRLTPASFSIGKDSPTVLHWSIESGPVRYDAIRGTVSQLSSTGLGPVTCLENDSPDADTTGFGDSPDPASGEAFFYLYRGSQGLFDGPGSYGHGFFGERVPSSGGCP